MKKRILAFFLAGVMAFPMISVETFAAPVSNEAVVKELEDGAGEPDGQREVIEDGSQEASDEDGKKISDEGSQEISNEGSRKTKRSRPLPY